MILNWKLLVSVNDSLFHFFESEFWWNKQHHCGTQQHQKWDISWPDERVSEFNHRYLFITFKSSATLRKSNFTFGFLFSSCLQIKFEIWSNLLSILLNFFYSQNNFFHDTYFLKIETSFNNTFIQCSIMCSCFHCLSQQQEWKEGFLTLFLSFEFLRALHINSNNLRTSVFQIFRSTSTKNLLFKCK